MVTKLLIKGGRVIDPRNSRDGKFDVLIQGEKIAEVAASIDAGGAKVVDAADLIVAPGFVDLHTHLREPGREDKETIETGCRAAVKGGFTTICAMPNTSPAMDQRGIVDLLKREADRVGLVHVEAVGAVTKGRAGKELTDFAELFDAGCVGLSDDGSPVADSLLMRRALEYARIFERPVIQHAEDPALFGNGVMHEGIVATTLGLRGIPSESESILVARDIALAELTGGWVHFAHISTAKSVELIRQAKRRGLRVTCEATPHHIALTHEAVGQFDTSAKVNPPLRAEADRQALIEGLRDGTIDAIATDHAPHTEWEKEADFDAAPFGISGLETALSVCVESLIATKQLTWSQLIEKLSSSPAKIAGSDMGHLSVGALADVVLIDPKQKWVVEPKQFISKGKNSPFAGQVLTAVVVKVFCCGAEVST